MKVDVKVDIRRIEEKFSERNYRRGRYALANQMLADMNQYVPFKEGGLRQATSINIDASAVNYHQKYARKQFYGQHKNYTTPGTGPRWDLKAESNHGKAWINAFARGAEFK